MLWGPSVAVVTALMAVSWSSEAAAQARRIGITGEVRVQYDSNVARGDDTVANVRSIRKSDITYTPTLTVDIFQPVGPHSAYVQGTLGYEFYQYNERLKRERINLNGGVRSRVGQCGVGVTGSLARGVSDVLDLGLDAQRSIQRSYTIGGNVGCPIAGRAGITASALHAESSNSGGATFVNSTTESASVGLTYGTPSAGTISLNGSVSTSDYEQTALTGLDSPGFDNYSIGVSYSRPIGARLNGQASVQYYTLKPKSSLAAESDGFTWNVGLNYSAGPRLSLNTSLSKSVNASNRIGSNSVKFTQAQLGANYKVSSRISAVLTGVVSRQDYGTPTIPGVLFSSKQDSRSLRAAINMNLGRRLDLQFDAGVSEVDSELDSLDYTSEQLGLTLRTRF